MGYAITLRLDAAAATVVEAMWQALASRGVSDEALQLRYPPHLTLAILADSADPQLLVAAARQCAAQWPKLPSIFASLGLFRGTPSTIFLAPIVTSELLGRHAALVSLLAGEPVDPYYAVGQFVPHVTLASDLADSAAAVAALGLSPLPITSLLDRLDVVRFRPVEVLESHSLANI
jgi:2'-5' RNA ligase